MNAVVTFGEVMGRLAAPDRQTLRQARHLEVVYAGAEANVAASICNFGGVARHVTALPTNALADAAIDTLRSLGIDAQHVVRTDHGRLGLYYLETGANQRPSKVIYDRADSAFSLTPADAYAWDAIFTGAKWLHVSGVTPALSKNAAAATIAAVRHAKATGLTVSFDLNFRAKLWRWDASRKPKELAQETIREIMPLVDVAIGNEEDFHDVLGIQAGATDVHSGKLDTARYPDVARQVAQQFPNVRLVAITLRESLSASHNNWGAMLYDAPAEQVWFAPLDGEGKYQPHEIRQIVDRVGSGDAFAGGLIHALMSEDFAAASEAIRFAVAASCLKHSILGDFNFATREDVAALMKGAASGRVIR